MNRLNAEFESGLPNLRGTHISGRIPVSQTVLNDILRAVAPMAAIELRDAGAMILTLPWIPSIAATNVRASAPLKVSFGLPLMARFALVALKGRFPYLALEGGEATVDLSAIPQFATYLPPKMVRITGLKISRGVLTIDFEITVV